MSTAFDDPFDDSGCLVEPVGLNVERGEAAFGGRGPVRPSVVQACEHREESLLELREAALISPDRVDEETEAREVPWTAWTRVEHLVREDFCVGEATLEERKTGADCGSLPLLQRERVAWSGVPDPSEFIAHLCDVPALDAFFRAEGPTRRL